MRRLATIGTMAAMAMAAALPAARAQSPGRCYMITYTYGGGTAAFQVRRFGNDAEQPLTFEQIIQLVQENVRNLGIPNASATPTGVFPVGCGKAG